MYIAIVATDKNRIAKFKDFNTKAEADAHIDHCKEFGFDSGFAVEAPKSGSMEYWVVDEKAKTITHDAITETADKATYDALAYSRSRKVEYPSIPEQLDYIYHNGIEKWKTDMILPVKNKYPKGDS